jgi:hypothetical protein
VFAALDALGRENTPSVHTAHQRGHGRDETRTLQVLPAPQGLFPCAAQAFLIERTVRDSHDGQLRSAAAALGITSRNLRRGGTTAVIAAAARGHWDIEVLHYVRSLGVLTLWHDVAPERSAGSFCNTSRGCGARCCRCSEARPAWTCHMHDNLAWRRRVDYDSTTCTIR